MSGFVKWESENVRICITIYHHFSSNFTGGKPCTSGHLNCVSHHIYTAMVYGLTHTSGDSSKPKNGKCVNWQSSVAQITQKFPAVNNHLYKNDGWINMNVIFVSQLGLWTLYCSPDGYLVQQSALYHSLCCNKVTMCSVCLQIRYGGSNAVIP
jgi:hypothetical protein